jgi:hypothetical protein
VCLCYVCCFNSILLNTDLSSFLPCTCEIIPLSKITTVLVMAVAEEAVVTFARAVKLERLTTSSVVKDTFT